MLEKVLNSAGQWIARRNRFVLVATVLLGIAATPFAIKALRNLDSNLFNQASAKLKRLSLIRELSETFGGDFLATVVTIPDVHSDADVKEMKTFALMLATELEKVGTLDEDRATIPDSVKADLDKLLPPAPAPAKSNSVEAMMEAEPAAQPTGPLPWLRNVECRTGQGIENGIRTLAKRHPYLLLEPADVETLKNLFEPAALDASMERIAKTALELPAHSPEKARLYEDPLGLADLGKTAYQERMKKRAPPLALDTEGFFLSPDGTTLVVLARTTLPSNKLEFARPLIAAVQRAENRAILNFRALKPAQSTALKSDQFGELANGEKPGRITAGFTGMSAIYIENEMSLKFDMALNTGTSLLGVFILFIVLYRSAMLTWQVMAATVYIIWLTIAVAGIWKGSMSMLGGAFTAVPVGLGTDYAILVYNTFQSLRANKKLSVSDALGETLAVCGPSILTGGFITAIAFFGVGFTELSGLAEFGVLGGASTVIGCTVMLVALPAWIALNANAGSAAKAAVPNEGLSLGMPTLGRWLEKRSARLSVIALSLMLLVAGVAVIIWGGNPNNEKVAGVKFDSELGNLRSLSSRSIPLRVRLNKRFNIGLSDISTIIKAPDEESAFLAMEEVHARMQPFIDRGEISYNSSVTDLLPSPKSQRASIAAMRTFDVDQSIQRFQAAAQKRFGVKGAAYFNPFLRRLRDVKMLLADPQPLALAKVLNGPLALMLAPMASIDPARKYPVHLRMSWLPRSAALPPTWFMSLIDAVEKNPSSNGALIHVATPKVVGMELKASTLADCGWITLIVGICVAVSLAFALRSLKKCLLACVPLLFAFLAMLAGVPIAQALGFDYSLNFVNLIMFPLLLGSAADYGVYMVFGYDVNPRPTLGALMSGTGRSVLYCMATTLIGFGSFVTSSYTGLMSMGVASLWGYAGATLGALIILPALLGEFLPAGKEKS